jgi:exodeoxyribonuclease V gamma subunit
MLHLHRAERADGLVQALATLLADPLPDPFAPELVAVPTRGMERWLTQRLSSHLGTRPGRADGVSANVAFPFPRRLVDEAVTAACGIALDEDPWRPERATWPLLEVVEAHSGEPWLRRLTVYLHGARDLPEEPRRARRLSSVRHLAELFDHYARQRPQMLHAWAEHRDADGSGRPLAPDMAWQAQLWRRLADRIAEPHPAARLEEACTRLRADPALTSLPARLSLFGLTRLPASHLRVLRALAAHRDVHLYLLHPSPALWQQIAQAVHTPVLHRRDDTTIDLPAHRLLASWGTDTRELQLVLTSQEEHTAHRHSVEHPTGTLLARLQADIRGDLAPPGAPLPGHEDERPLLDAADRSVQVHACHGRARQVEVIRDAILHELEEDPSLEPRDVIVMCPDIETFAPLIQASFGAGDGEEPGTLRVRLADRSLRQTNPVLGVVAALLDLVGGRLTASQVLDLADREPVRRRFRWDDDDLTRIREWVTESGIRWGLDAAHRAPFKLSSLPSGTWSTGIDRVLLGATMTEEGQHLFGGALPLDDVESGSIELAGRLAEFVDRLRTALDALDRTMTIDAGAAALGQAADALTATSERDGWQRAELQRLLDDVVRDATVAESTALLPIAPPELRALLSARLQGRPTRANFRTGHLTICTLVPMRSVPHRVVCLLGLDDGVFPRKSPRDGDDLLLDDPWIGDRDPRTEDRQMLLDALMAATDRLIVTYTGNDERTNSVRPPAVPVGELLDVVDATVRSDEAHVAAHTRVVVRHPLQPFDPRNFALGALVAGRTWSFDPVTLEGARALTVPRAAPGPFLAGSLPAPQATEVLEIEDLVRFVRHPVRAFLRQRLGVSVGDFSQELEDGMRVELDGLGKWGVGQRLLEARLAGVDRRTAKLAEIARGTLPPGVLGAPLVNEEVMPIVDDLLTAAEGVFGDGASPGSLDVRVVLPDGRLLTGSIPGVGDELLRAVTYSRVAPKHRITAWVRLLALTAAHPQRPFHAATVGKGQGRGAVSVAHLRPLADDPLERRRVAMAQLVALVNLYDRGMREPAPLYCATSAAYAVAARVGGDATAAAQGAWESTWDREKEDREKEHLLVFDGVRTVEDLMREEPRADEQGEGWEAGEATRFGRYARRLWDGLLAVEELKAR